MKRCLPFALVLLTASAFAQPEVSRLRVPQGFRVALFAETGTRPRMMAFSPGGTLLVTGTSDGVVLALPANLRTQKAARVVTVLQDRNAPHGLAFHGGKLYIAETDSVWRYDWDESRLAATNGRRIASIPGRGGHFTRTLVFANGKMYVSVGSSCNVCEDEPGRAAIHEFNVDGSGGRIFARGTRNAVGLAVSPQTGTVWGTENGRDWLGDDLPPEEINDFGKEGGDFGWPYCHGDRVPDLTYSERAVQHCPGTIAPKAKFQAHSAPLGLAFYTGTAFPREYHNDLFVAYHGSWNRSVPTGYKVVRMRVSPAGTVGSTMDFLTGFVRPGETRKGAWMGRPVGIAIAPDGAMFVSDDGNGAIYRITWEGR